MTTDAPSPERVEVEQVDREAAADYATISGSRVIRKARQAIRHGRCDDWDIVQAFARHRIATAQASDAEIERLKRSRETVWATLKKAEADFARAEAESARLREALEAVSREANESARLLGERFIATQRLLLAANSNSSRFKIAATCACAGLAAAISLLEKADPKIAPSNAMFEQMLGDYRDRLERAKAALAAGTSQEVGRG